MGKKKASPRKSQPLLTYEKHRVKIRKKTFTILRKAYFFFSDIFYFENIQKKVNPEKSLIFPFFHLFHSFFHQWGLIFLGSISHMGCIFQHPTEIVF